MPSVFNKKPARIAGLILGVGIIIFWQGIIRRPTDPAEGTALLNVAAATQPTGDILRVCTFNIAGGVSPKDNVEDLHRTAEMLRGYDLAGLEEVHGAEILDHRDQAQVLGEDVKMPYLFAPSERRWWHDSFGNGILCDLPVEHWWRTPLSTSRSSTNRTLLKAIVRWQGADVTVLITHLDRHEDHDVELGAVLAAFHDSADPAILLGDLNTDTHDPRLLKLRNDPDVTDVIDQTVTNLDPSNVDWIFARKFKCVAGGLKDNDASDHRLAWGNLVMTP